MTLTAIVLVYLFGVGVLMLLGLWSLRRALRHAAIRERLHSRRLVRARRQLQRLSIEVRRLSAPVRPLPDDPALREEPAHEGCQGHRRAQR